MLLGWDQQWEDSRSPCVCLGGPSPAPLTDVCITALACPQGVPGNWAVWHCCQCASQVQSLWNVPYFYAFILFKCLVFHFLLMWSPVERYCGCQDPDGGHCRHGRCLCRPVFLTKYARLSYTFIDMNFSIPWVLCLQGGGNWSSWCWQVWEDESRLHGLWCLQHFQEYSKYNF